MRKSDLGNLDIDLLIALDALIRHQNVSQAAQELGLSQPALSTRLSRLRRVFADKLFVSSVSGRGMTPTLRAEALGAQLADLLPRLRAMVSPPEEFGPATSERTFVIGLYRNPAAMLAPDLLPHVAALAPGVRLAFVWLYGGQAVEQLENGAIDLILGSDLPIPGDIIVRLLLEEALVTAQRVGHPRGNAPLDLDVFCRLPHVIVSETGASFTDIVDQELGVIGRARQVVASLQSYAVLPTVVERSDCLCTLPESFLARYGRTLDTFQPPLALGPPDSVPIGTHDSRVMPDMLGCVAPSPTSYPCRRLASDDGALSGS